jgi:SAM-dependent methyltransferase
MTSMIIKDRAISDSKPIVKKTLIPFQEYHEPLKAKRDLSPEQIQMVNDFNDRIKDNSIKLEFVPCLCGNAEFDLLASVDGFSFLQKTVICRHCGLMQSNPRMTEESFREFYTSDIYRKCYESENYIQLYKETKYSQQTGLHIYNEITKVVKDISICSVMEFGAGGGWNLLPFIKAGANVLGIEYSTSLVNLGRNFGINMKQGSIDEIEGMFDIIIINHVLEHFSNPVESLKKILTHLKKDGIIYIAVPNNRNFWLGDLQNAHTYYFSPKTFIYYCFMADLKVLASGPSEDIHIFGIFKKNGDESKDYNLNGHYKEMYLYFMRKRFIYPIKFVLNKIR